MPRLRRKMWGRQGRPVGFPDVRGSQWNSIQNSSDLISSWIKTLELSWMFQWWTELWIELWFYPYSPWTMGSQGATKWVSQLQLNDRLVSWGINHCDLPRTCFLPLRYALVCHDFLAEFIESTGFVSYWKWIEMASVRFHDGIVCLCSVLGVSHPMAHRLHLAAVESGVEPNVSM
jgi:hypothetical protein